MHLASLLFRHPESMLIRDQPENSETLPRYPHSPAITTRFARTELCPQITNRPQSTVWYGSLLTISSAFDPLFRVLFTFPSQYFFAIGLVAVFSFGWDQPPVLGLQSQTTRLDEREMTIGPTPWRTGLSPSVADRSRTLMPRRRPIISQSKNYNSTPFK